MVSREIKSASLIICLVQIIDEVLFDEILRNTVPLLESLDTVFSDRVRASFIED